MERIKKALDKAREQRTCSPSIRQTVSASGHKSGVLAKDILYSETKSILSSKEALRDKRVILGSRDDPLSDIYKILRTKVMHRLQALGMNTLAVTSPNPGGGKTLTAINLSISIALDTKYSVLLVDLDLRRPSLHNYFSIEAEKGLSDYLLHNTPISELLLNPGIDRLVLLPGGKSQSHSSELLATPQMIGLLEEIKSRYADRIIIFDLPPILSSDDALVFMPHAGTSLLVVEEGVNTVDEVSQSLQLMEQSKFLGTVLNKSADYQYAVYY